MKIKSQNILLILCLLIFNTSGAQSSPLWNIRDGINLYNKTDYKNAKSFFEEYTKNNPNNENGYYQLGRTYLKLKNSAEAQKNFEKSYELASKETNIEKLKFNKESMSLNDYFDMAVMYFEEGNLQEADYYADMMLKLDPKNSNAWFVKAKVANSQNQKEIAKGYLNSAIIYNNKLLKTNLAKNLNIYSVPKATKEIYNLFALEAYYKGDLEKAIINYKQYLEIDKTNVDVFNMLAKIYLIRDDIENALKYIDLAQQISENTKTLLLKAEIYENNNEIKKQEDALLKAYKINPNNAEMLLEAGNFYLKKEDYTKAKQYFETLININDNLYEGYFGYILCLIREGKNKPAISYIRQALSINPTASEINYLLALICYKQGQTQEAFDYLEEAINSDKNPNYYLLKAEIQYYLSDYYNSLASLDLISSLNGSVFDKNKESELYLKNYIKTQQFENAQYYLNKNAGNIDKNSLTYKYILYKIYKNQGNDKKADFLYTQIKMPKIASQKEYLETSEILFYEKGSNEAIKLLDKLIKKTPEEYNLYCQKIKIYLMTKQYEKIKNVLDKIREIFG